MQFQISTLFEGMNDKLNQQELEQWATVSWAIWNARNKFCFEKTQRHPEQILREATGFLAEYQRLNAAQVQKDGLFSVVGALSSTFSVAQLGYWFLVSIMWPWPDLVQGNNLVFFFTDVFMFYLALLLCPGGKWPNFCNTLALFTSINFYQLSQKKYIYIVDILCENCVNCEVVYMYERETIIYLTAYSLRNFSMYALYHLNS